MSHSASLLPNVRDELLEPAERGRIEGRTGGSSFFSSRSRLALNRVDLGLLDLWLFFSTFFVFVFGLARVFLTSFISIFSAFLLRSLQWNTTEVPILTRFCGLPFFFKKKGNYKIKKILLKWLNNFRRFAITSIVNAVTLLFDGLLFTVMRTGDSECIQKKIECVCVCECEFILNDFEILFVIKNFFFL